MNNGDIGSIAGIFGGAFAIIIYIAVIVLIIASQWKIFTKAGKPGWASLIPIYNIIVLLEVARQPLWMIILLFIPVANIIVFIIVSIELAKNFGKSGGFAAGLILLSIIFYPLLAFGSAEYQDAAPASA
ncbi:MAG TPA: signal peptidase I [Actinobacteria bacterium]|nr:signal peptidase I [Actinomycetota bacterium]